MRILAPSVFALGLAVLRPDSMNALPRGGKSAPSGGPSVPDLLFDLPGASFPWVPLLAVFLFLFATALAVLFFLRRRRRTEAESAREAGPPPRSPAPEEEALDAIASLEARLPFSDPGEEDSFHVALSRVLRKYLSERSGIPALPMAAEEVLESFAGCDPPPEALGNLEKVLARCEAVKFSGKARSGEEARARECLEDAVLFVRAAAENPVRREGEEAP